VKNFENQVWLNWVLRFYPTIAIYNASVVVVNLKVVGLVGSLVSFFLMELGRNFEPWGIMPKRQLKQGVNFSHVFENPFKKLSSGTSPYDRTKATLSTNVKQERTWSQRRRPSVYVCTYMFNSLEALLVLAFGTL
jgi:hypothetical protein